MLQDFHLALRTPRRAATPLVLPLRPMQSRRPRWRQQQSHQWTPLELTTMPARPVQGSRSARVRLRHELRRGILTTMHGPEGGMAGGGDPPGARTPLPRGQRSRTPAPVLHISPGAGSIDPRRAADQRGRDARPRATEPVGETVDVPPFPMFVAAAPAPGRRPDGPDDTTVRSRSHPGLGRTRQHEVADVASRTTAPSGQWGRRGRASRSGTSPLGRVRSQRERGRGEELRVLPCRHQGPPMGEGWAPRGVQVDACVRLKPRRRSLKPGDLASLITVATHH